MVEAGGGGGLWYVMLFPSPEEGASLVAALAGATGGEPTPTPHVTVGYFRRALAPAAVVHCARLLTGPPTPVRAAGLFSWTERPHSQFGYTLSLRVRRDAALRGWQRTARDALVPAGLAPLFTGIDPVGWTRSRSATFDKVVPHRYANVTPRPARPDGRLRRRRG